MVLPLVAVAATVLYYLAFAVWKVAAGQMEPLRGDRPLRLFVVVTANPLWWAGMVLTNAGALLQGVVLTSAPLAEVTPFFTAGLLIVLPIAVFGFGERLSGREWLCLGLIAAAMLLAGVSADALSIGTRVPTAAVLTVAAVSVALPLALFTLGDAPEGRHARPAAGVAYGIGIGIVAGTSELMIKALADLRAAGLGLAEMAATPYFYVLVTTAVISWGMTQIALQRARLAVVMTVGTLTAQTHLLFTGGLVYGEGWPDEASGVLLRAGALLLTGAALLLFPRVERVSAG